MNEYYGFIYLWMNTYPGVIKHAKYIGLHAGKIDDNYIGSGTIFIKKYYCNKYKGFWVRHILEFCQNKEHLEQAELKWINFYNAVEDNSFCNYRYGGYNGKLSNNTKIKISSKLKGRIPWNKGMTGVVKQSDNTIKKRINTVVSNKNYNQRDLDMLEIIKQRGYFKMADAVSLAKDKATIKRLMNSQKIRPEYFGLNDVRYVLFDFSLETEVIEFIKSNNECTRNDIFIFFNKKHNLTRSKICTITQNLVKKNKIKQTRGYKKNYWSVL